MTYMENSKYLIFTTINNGVLNVFSTLKLVSTRCAQQNSNYLTFYRGEYRLHSNKKRNILVLYTVYSPV